MAKTKISEFSATAANNTDIDGINIAEGCAPSGINNAIRELMSQLKDQQTGASADNFTVGGNLVVTGTTTLSSALAVNQGGTGQITATDAINGLMPSQTGNSGKYLTTNGVAIAWGAVTPGTGTVTSVAMSTSLSGLSVTGSPVTSTGTLALSGTLGVGSGGTGATTLTANGVIIGNGTSALTAISPSTSGNVLLSNGTNWSSAAFPSASASVSGIVNTTTQTFAGAKTFSGAVVCGTTLDVSSTVSFSGTLGVGGAVTCSSTGEFNGLVTGNGFLSSAGSYNFTASNESIFGSAGSVTISVGGASRCGSTTAAFRPTNDIGLTLGTAGLRWGQIYSSVGTISTSDRNSKQNIEEINDVEKKVAVKLKGLFKKYKFKDAVTSKGNQARTHFGIIAQDVESAFLSENLNANEYGIFCSDTWYEKEEVVNGKNEIVIYESQVDGSIEKTRLGVRYDELFAFIISSI